MRGARCLPSFDDVGTTFGVGAADRGIFRGDCGWRLHEGRCRGGANALWRRLETMFERLGLGHEFTDQEHMNTA